jgi:type VI secretion system protein ImpA
MTEEATRLEAPTSATELDELLAPISVEHPAGEWLRDGPDYDAIQKARSEEDPNLPRGVWERELDKADWRAVEARCVDVLQNRSKDAQVAAWLMESWIHLNGFAGAARGLALLAGLYEAFWDGLHPPLEDGGDPDYRLMPVRWVEDKLTLQLKQVPITEPRNGDASAFAWADWQGALRLERLLSAGVTKAEETGDKVTRDKFLTSVTLTPSAFFLELDRELASGRSAADDLTQTLQKSCGDEAPGLRPLKDLLGAIAHFTGQVLEERAETASPGDEGEGDATEPGTTPAGHSAGGEVPVPAAGPIASRAEAYRRLSQAAEYLLRTEPHSPTAYLIKRAVSWGNLTLPELLSELLRDNADLDTVYKLLGLQKPESGGPGG